MSLAPRIHAEGVSRLAAYDQGAQLASWEVDGEPVVWLSEAAVLDGGAPIRGGVPICFPWFADGPDGQHSPAHGLVRTAVWHPLPAQGERLWAWEIDSDDVATAPGAHLVPGPFRLRYAVHLSPTGDEGTPTLSLQLAVHNPGPSTWTAEVALHTYLGVRDVTQVEILGLAGADYLDKVSGARARQEGVLRPAGETDRVYDRSGRVVVRDRAGARELALTPCGATQTVVWNPGAVKAGTARDLTGEGWRRFVCVETAATGEHALTLAPGRTHTLGCSLTTRTVSPL